MVIVAERRGALPIASVSNSVCAATRAIVSAGAAGTRPAATDAFASSPSKRAMAASSFSSERESAQDSSQNACWSGDISVQTRRGLGPAPDVFGGLDHQAQFGALRFDSNVVAVHRAGE